MLSVRCYKGMEVRVSASDQNLKSRHSAVVVGGNRDWLIELVTKRAAFHHFRRGSKTFKYTGDGMLTRIIDGFCGYDLEPGQGSRGVLLREVTQFHSPSPGNFPSKSASQTWTQCVVAVRGSFCAAAETPHGFFQWHEHLG